MRARFARLAVVLLLGTLGPALAADVRLAGKKLVLRKSPTAEHLVLIARGEVVAPLPGSTEDPTLVGGDLEIRNPGTGEHARFTTSARDWTVNALGTVFRFRNHLESGPGSEVRTEWKTKEIWIRREFALDQLPAGEVVLMLHHDEDAEVYLNGVLAARVKRHVTDYEEVAIRPEALKALKRGKNVLAVTCRQTGGGQYIDVGLAEVKAPR